MTEPIFDHDRLDVYRLSIDYVAFSYRISKGLAGMNRPATVAEGAVEYEYRDAEYEYEDSQPVSLAA